MAHQSGVTPPWRHNSKTATGCSFPSCYHKKRQKFKTWVQKKFKYLRTGIYFPEVFSIKRCSLSSGSISESSCPFPWSIVERGKSRQVGRTCIFWFGNNLVHHSTFRRRMLLCGVYVQYAHVVKPNPSSIYNGFSFYLRPAHINQPLRKADIEKHNNVNKHKKRIHCIFPVKLRVINPAHLTCLPSWPTLVWPRTTVRMLSSSRLWHVTHNGM